MSIADPSTFAIAPGYRANLSPAYFDDDTSDGVIWQPDVYPFAAALAEALRCGQIIDVGCGRGGKLAPLHDRFSIVGLDYGSNLAECRANYAWGTWVDVDLEAPTVAEDATWVNRPSVIVSADVIEHLIDPRGTLGLFRRLLAVSPLAVISTPERHLRRGIDHVGPPLNPCHVREWTLSELCEFCARQGLSVAWSGLTRMNSMTSDRTTALVVVTLGTRPDVRSERVAAIAAQHNMTSLY